MLGARYRLLRVLGRGGMGVVYEARQEDLGRAVAVKVLPAGLAVPAARARFEREARITAALGHPHIVQVTDLGTSAEGVPFLVMELLHGASLRDLLLRDGPFEATRAAQIALQILSALGAAHRAQVVHRDVKPDNVFRVEHSGSFDFVKVLDFGVARPLDAEPMTDSGALVGTLAFMAPEQVRGEPVDGRTDLYGVAATLFTLVSGRKPFESAPGLLEQILTTPAPRLDLVTTVDAGLAAIVARGLEKAKERRFASAEEMASELARWLEQRGVHVPSSALAPPTAFDPGAAVALQATVASASSTASAPPTPVATKPVPSTAPPTHPSAAPPTQTAAGPPPHPSAGPPPAGRGGPPSPGGPGPAPASRTMASAPSQPVPSHAVSPRAAAPRRTGGAAIVLGIVAGAGVLGLALVAVGALYIHHLSTREAAGPGTDAALASSAAGGAGAAGAASGASGAGASRPPASIVVPASAPTPSPRPKPSAPPSAAPSGAPTTPPSGLPLASGKDGRSIGVACKRQADCHLYGEYCKGDGLCYCSAPQKRCGPVDGPCLSLLTRDNCGDCGKRCADDEICAVSFSPVSASHCERCPAGKVRCGTACQSTQSLQTDNGNCGGCGKACAPGDTCKGGVCTH